MASNNFPTFAPSTPLEDRLDAGRSVLRHCLPLVWPITLRFRYVVTEAIPTSAVDLQGNLYINPKWLCGEPLEGVPADCTIESALDVAVVLAHEAMHLLLRHLERLPPSTFADPYERCLANISCDCALNQLLGETVLRSSPVFQGMMKHLDTQFQGKLFPIMEQQDVAESILHELRKLPPPPGGGHGNCVIRASDCGKGDQADNAADQAGQGQQPQQAGASGPQPPQAPDWNLLTQEGVSLQKQRGDQKGTRMGNLLDALDNSKIPWPQLVGPYLSECMEPDRYVWHRLPRRPSPDPDIMLPGIERKRGCVAALVDTSGSMGPEEIQISLTELTALTQQLDVDLFVMLHNVGPYYGKLVTEASQLKGLPYSAGGTSHQPSFAVIEGALQGKLEPDAELLEDCGTEPWDPMPDNLQAVVCFTDMYSSFPERCTLPTVWINTTGALGDNCPFGVEVAYVR